MRSSFFPVTLSPLAFKYGFKSSTFSFPSFPEAASACNKLNKKTMSIAVGMQASHAFYAFLGEAGNEDLQSNMPCVALCKAFPGILCLRGDRCREESKEYARQEAHISYCWDQSNMTLSPCIASAPFYVRHTLKLKKAEGAKA